MLVISHGRVLSLLMLDRAFRSGDCWIMGGLSAESARLLAAELR